ncbi:hypothetical protein [Bradyrhizobium sp. ORS 86]|uniref:hypothetical protein n=1 Tax=Bradyrhizobium sp. ORS 86 TaxID=1685970 RepID=UPI00388D7EC0
MARKRWDWQGSRSFSKSSPGGAQIGGMRARNSEKAPGRCGAIGIRGILIKYHFAGLPAMDVIDAPLGKPGFESEAGPALLPADAKSNIDASDGKKRIPATKLMS